MILSGPNFGSNFAHNHSHGYKTWNHYNHNYHQRRHKQQKQSDEFASISTNGSAIKQQAFGSLRRAPAPRQPAPERPNSLMACLMNGLPQEAPQPPERRALETTQIPQSNEYSARSHRASTLNRLDVLKRRQQQQLQLANAAPSNSTTIALRRNLSSLGHYPAARPTDGYNSERYSHWPSAADQQQRRRPPSESIYAPASIASPHEFNNTYSYSTLIKPAPRIVQEAAELDQQEQHYASASVGGQYRDQQIQPGSGGFNRMRSEDTSSPANTSQRPGSSLGQLLERFGSALRQKARRHFARAGSWSSSYQRRSQTPHSQIYAPASVAGFPPRHLTTGSDSSYGSPRTRSSSQAPDSGYVSTPPLPLGKPLVLDPELYASGKRELKADEIYAEGLRALDCNAERRRLEHQLLEPQLMAEGETCTIIDEQSRQQADYQLLVRQLVNWLNDELAEQRIVVRDLQDDLYDGQVLCKLIEKFYPNCKLDIVEVTQNERLQRRKLSLVLEIVNRTLTTTTAAAGPHTARPQIKWSVEGIHSKNMVEILHLLAAMALLCKAPVRLPANVTVQVLVFQKYQHELVRRSHQVRLTGDESVGPSSSSSTRPINAPAVQPNDPAANRRDAFDLLLECAPDKLHVVKQSLARFCNRHLNKINMSCGSNDDLTPDHFSDGLLLVFLISSLEGFFVPLGNLFTTTTTRTRTADKPDDKLPFIDANNNNVAADATYEAIGRATALEPDSFTCSQPIERLHNVNVALQLIEEAGLVDIRHRVRPEEIVNGDLKAVLRVLYALFGRYKHL